jgi:uncharacterized protein YbjT (DUF2867 family)
MKPIIAIAGASGFVGKWFIERFYNDYHIIAFTRKKVLDPIRSEVEWRLVDLYSLSSTSEALKGADYALYLVHSMQPSTRLNQSSFEDTDLLLADNFARAANVNNLKQIIYMGGILPKETKEYSKHLRSRYEVEKTLASKGIPVTALRAGIIIGPGGSSFRIVDKLVKRLPAMACPKWTISESQPIDIRDVLTTIDFVAGNQKYYDQYLEIGGHEVITYMDIMKKTAEISGKKRIIFSVPFLSVGLSRLWVAMFTNSSPSFITPLIESLRHDMKVEKQDNQLPPPKYSLDEMIAYAIEGKDDIPKLPRRNPGTKEKNTVRSVQRLPNPQSLTAIEISRLYRKWLPSLLKYLIRVDINEDISSFRLLGFEVLKLQSIEDRSDENRQLFFIVDGLLVKRKDYGWLEFRNVLDNKYTIGAIHEFVPKLPWYLYILTQAQIHLWVMKRFGLYLKKSAS